jgi:hypothetical protein
MSANARLLWIIPAVLLASWLAVRSLAASPAPDRERWAIRPAVCGAFVRVRDPALAS